MDEDDELDSSRDLDDYFFTVLDEGLQCTVAAEGENAHGRWMIATIIPNILWEVVIPADTFLDDFDEVGLFFQRRDAVVLFNFRDLAADGSRMAYPILYDPE